MTDLPESTHLRHLERCLATLVASLEQTGAAAEPLRLARRLLAEVQGTTDAIADDPQLVDALQRIDHSYRKSLAQLAKLHDSLDHIPHPHRPVQHDHPGSTGSRIGDAVRDSFLNMGGESREGTRGAKTPGT